MTRAAGTSIFASMKCRGFRAERASGDPTDFMIRCAQCGNIFRFLQKTAYAPGGEPRVKA